MIADPYTYQFDDLDNLISATRPGRSVTYDYQAGTQRLNALRDSTTSAELIGYQFDARGNVTQRRAQAMGRSNQDFRFDRANRLAEVRAQNSPTLQAQYRYDGADRRIQTQDADGKRVQIYSQGGQLVWEVATPCTPGQIGCASQSENIFANGFENPLEPTAQAEAQQHCTHS